MSAPSWGVVATVDEPTALVLAYAGWHRAIGAAEVHLYLDSPDPETEAALKALNDRVGGVFATVCDADYWAASPKGKRGGWTTRRQMVNADHAYARAQVDWLLNSDADEFVRDGAVLAAKLTELPPDVPALRLPTLERVHLEGEPGAHIFEGAFRRRNGQFGKLGPRLYGRWAKFLAFGLTGHPVGKSLVRTGLDIRNSIHFPLTQAGKQLRPEQVLKGQLLHFDGLTPLHFLLKLANRMGTRHYQPGRNNPDGVARSEQADFVRRKVDKPDALAHFAWKAQGLDAGQQAALSALGVLQFEPFDPRPALSGLGLEFDLSPAAFDAALRRRKADLIAGTGLAV